MQAVISLGSNLEPRAHYLNRAIERLSEFPATRLVRKSSVRQTDPVDVPALFVALKFLNQVAVFETNLEVHDFSKQMHAVEQELGRVRTTHNGPRTIDLDLITFGDLELDEPELMLPHPRAVGREFVMKPLRELWLQELNDKYDRYVDSFRDEDGNLPEMMHLKYEHTRLVVENAELIAKGEQFSSEERFAAVAAALLHDTGRYEQLKRYNTFKDSDSIDHAVFSHDIVEEQGWLDALPGFGILCPGLGKVILDAVLYHNRREIPGKLDQLTELVSHTVRDADKLDIFRVLENQIAHSDWRKDSRAFWNLQVGVPPNPAVVEAIRAHRPVKYQDIKSLGDFVLIQIGWMISELHFNTTRQLCRERKHLDFRRKFLDEVGGGPVAASLCDLVE